MGHTERERRRRRRKSKVGTYDEMKRNQPEESDSCKTPIAEDEQTKQESSERQAQEKRLKMEEICGEDFPLPRNFLVKVLKHMKQDKDNSSLLAFKLTCKFFKEVQNEVGFNQSRESSGLINYSKYLNSLEPQYRSVSPSWIRWMYDVLVGRRDPKEVDTIGILLHIAARNGHLSELKWLHNRRYAWTSSTTAYAALGGHLNVLQWLRSKGCPWDEQTCTMAAAKGHLDTLQWAHSQGCPWDEGTCSYAALGGHLKVLQWARSQGCPWNSWIWKYARLSGNSEILEWLKTQDYPKEDDDFARATVRMMTTAIINVIAAVAMFTISEVEWQRLE